MFAHGIAGNGADCAEGLRAAMADLDATLRSAGSAMDCVERITLYVRDTAQLPSVDMTGAGQRRASDTMVRSLRDDVHVELEATATLVDAA